MTTVLIVDDYAPFRDSARGLLESGGFDVVGEAEDGAGALAAARRLRPDVVLLDVQLPDMTSSRDVSEFGGLVERCGARGFVSNGELSRVALTALLE